MGGLWSGLGFVTDWWNQQQYGQDYKDWQAANEGTLSNVGGMYQGLTSRIMGPSAGHGRRYPPGYQPRGINEAAEMYGGIAQDYYGQGAAGDRYAGAMDPLSEQYGMLPTQFGESGARIMGGYMDAARASGQTGFDITSGYEGLGTTSAAAGGDIVNAARDRYEMAAATGGEMVDYATGRLNLGMGMMEGMGTQARADIGQRYGALDSQQRADMVSRGIMGTTAPSAGGVGLEQARSADVARLEEQLLGTRMGTYAGLSGDVMGAMGGAAASRLGASGDVINAMGGQQAIGNQLGLAGLGAQELQQGRGYEAAMASLSAEERQQLGLRDTRMMSLAARENLAAGGLGYQDAAMANMLHYGPGFAQMPYGYDIALTGTMADLYAGVQRPPPYPPQSTGWGQYSGWN